MKKNPFGDEEPVVPRPANPFGDEARETQSPAEAADHIEYVARKIRNLRGRMGAEGLTLTATRELIDDIAGALEAAARAFRSVE